MGLVSTWVFNFVLGIIGTALIASQISSGKSISFENGIQFHLNIYNMGLILYIVLIAVYFWGAKRMWGKTPGGLLADKLTSKKK